MGHLVRWPAGLAGIWVHVSAQWGGEGLSGSIISEAAVPGDHLLLDKCHPAWLLWSVYRFRLGRFANGSF